MGERVEESLVWSPTTPGEVVKLFQNHKPVKEHGWDGVSPPAIGR